MKKIDRKKGPDLSIKLAGIKFKNPVWAASGTFGYGEELERFTKISEVGAIVTKTVTLEKRQGNKPPRVIETPSGLLNSIGLENDGAAYFVEKKYPFLKKTGTAVIVSFACFSYQEWRRCAEILTDGKFPNALELNLSCPNVSHGKKEKLIAQDSRAVEKVVREVKTATDRPVIAKLSPDVTDIGEIAAAAERAGADAVSVANTFQGVAIDAEAMKPYFEREIGGLSGPAIKPLALKAVRDAYRAVKIPIIGIGGIMTGMDAAEFLLSGASAVQAGTATLRDPGACSMIRDQLEDYMRRHSVEKISFLKGRLWR